MAFQLKSTKTFIDEYGLSVLVMGAPGIGKTSLIKTAPNPIILSTEQGLSVLQDEDIPYAIINSLDDLEEAYGILRESEYETICLDSLSDFASKELIRLSNGNKNVPLQLYGDVGRRLTTIIEKFRAIPRKNIYFIAQMSMLDIGGESHYYPSVLTKNYSQTIAYPFDEVFVMRSFQDEEGVYRGLQTYSDNIYACLKDRSGKLDPIEEPNLGKLIKKIKGETNG